MAELVKTTSHGKGRASHYHIAYLRDDATGLTSFDNGHRHYFVMDGMGVWVMEKDSGHTHDLLPEYDYKQPGKKQEESELVLEVLSLYDEAVELERESREAGYKAEDLYSHKQWDEKKKKELESKERAALTINKTESKIDNLCGYQRQNRMDIKYLPMENGDARVADILNIASKHITDACFFPREESKVFEDASLVGRGVFNIYEDFDEDIQGKIIIEKFKWDEARFGPHEKEDLSDCDFITKDKWYSIAKLKEMYPDKADKLSPESRANLGGSDKVAEDWDKRLNTEEFVNIAKKKYKVIECQRKEYKRVFILVNASDSFVFNAEGWKGEDIAAVKTIGGFNKIPRTSYRLRVTKIASSVLLEDEYIDEKDFSVLPLYAKFRNGQWWGKIEGIKDLQFLVNKAYSQFIDIINKVANYGWFYDNGTFADKREEDRFRKNASSPGFVVKLSDVNRPPEKVEGMKFPIELTNALTMFNQDMREILNVNLEMQGLDSSGQSGVAMKQKIVQQLLGNDFLFDNLSFVKKKLGQILVRKIQKRYDAKRLMRILANEAARGKVEIGGRPIDEYAPEELQELLEKADLSLYDVVVSESPNSPSALMGNFLMLLELAGKGIPIPPQAIMEFAPMPQKDKVMGMINAQMQQQAEMDKMKFDTEIKKSLIAAQSKTGGTMPGESGMGMA